jgi:hypothetical protein
MAVSYKIMKCSAISQTSLGILLIILGGIDRIHIHRQYPTIAVIPIWMGFWVSTVAILSQ